MSTLLAPSGMQRHSSVHFPNRCPCWQEQTATLSCLHAGRQAEAAAEAKLKGPLPFPLEMLLATFCELCNA